jgi:acetyl esterase/lipase
MHHGFEPCLPAVMQIIDTTEPFVLSFDDVPATRAQMSAMGAQQRASLNLPTDNVETIPITMRDGFATEMLLVKPRKIPSGGSPLIVLAFGGGFCIGAKEDMLPLAHKLQDFFGATVVLVTYRLAPEHKFPTAPHDVWDCFEYAAKNAESLGASLKAGFIVGGISAGGNLAAVTARKAVAEGMPLTGAWLDIPVLLDPISVPEEYKTVYLARQQNANAYVLNEGHAQFIKGAYEMDPNSPDYSPFGYSNPADMPPTFIQV